MADGQKSSECRELLKVRDVTKRFRLEAGLFASGKKQVFALNGVSFSVAEGETYGLVGESGSGKSTLAKCIADVYSCDEGEMIFFSRGAAFRLDAAERKRHPLLNQKIKYVFQDPAASLDPRMTVEEILTIGVRYAKLYSRSQARDKAAFLLEAVGMAADSLKRRPADFSGGQRQRISLARALMSDPELLICDEVVLKKEFGFAMLFIAHDLSVVSYISDRIGVMYGGRLMEEGAVRELFDRPLHPYTQLLLSCVPDAGGEFLRTSGSGEPFDAVNPPIGCPFAPRCPIADSECRKKDALSAVRASKERLCLCLKRNQLSK